MLSFKLVNKNLKTNIKETTFSSLGSKLSPLPIGQAHTSKAGRMAGGGGGGEGGGGGACF